MEWIKNSFEEFSKGTFGNGGQNIYASANGVLQRIFNFDLNGDGYFDLPLANSHSMWECPPLHIYDSLGQEKPLELPSQGSFDAVFTDLTGDGTDDLVVACQHNGVHNDVSAMIYYGSEMGLSEKYCQEIRVPNSFGVVAGDFNGCGKKALAFICGQKIRIFYQTELGIEGAKYTEIDICAVSIAVGDLDGDGFDDLYVFHQGTGELAVYWGGKDGLVPDRKTIIGKSVLIDDHRANSTTAGRKLYHWMPWKSSVVEANGKLMTFRAEDNYAVFESFDKNRKPCVEFCIKCNEPVTDDRAGRNFAFAGKGPMHAISGDLKNDGSKDIVIAVATDFNNVEDVIVLWQDKGYAFDEATRIPIRAARSLSVGKMEPNGKNYLFITQSSTDTDLDVENAIYSFDKSGKPILERKIPTHEATRLISGKTYTDGRYQLAVINHEGETKVGLEDVYIFFGGEDGFSADRRVELPGCAAVECIPVDVNDDGKPEIIVVNCAENGPSLDPGTAVYYSVNGKFAPDQCVHLNTLVAHGCAIGDFRHTGYLDLIFSGIYDRKLTVLEGGPNGFSKEPKKIILGPHPELARPRRRLGPDEEKVDYTQDECERMLEYGNPRWIFAADFNNDGWLDLYITQISGSRAMILWGSENGFSYENRQELGAEGTSSGVAADLTGNGYLDLVTSGSESSGKQNVKEAYVTVYWGSKEGYSGNRKVQLPVFSADGVTVNDFNGDGKLDIFAAAYNGGRSRDVDSVIYFANEDGYFNRGNCKKIRTHSASGCLSGDFNGDGYIDLAVANHKKEGCHVCESVVYWGGPDGIDEERCTLLPGRGPHGMTTIDVGNIMDRGDAEYYYSEAYKVADGERATRVSWTAENGKKTWVKMQLRCADTEAELENAEWSEPFENEADVSGLNLTGYVQYRLELGAKCGIGTPRVSEVRVTFN